MGENDRQRLSQYLIRHDWEAPPITGQMLRTTSLSRPTSAPGFDRITQGILAKLPLEAWNKLGTLYQRQLGEVMAAAIPKAQSQGVCGALKQRVISIASHVYRIWSSCRATQLNQHWVPHVAPEEVYGGRPELAARTASIAESLAWDTALRLQTGWASIYVDSSKCLDVMQYPDILFFAEAMGCPRGILRAARSWLALHTRSPHLNRAIPEPLHPKRGVPQGCGLSVIWAIVWSTTWARHVLQLVR